MKKLFLLALLLAVFISSRGQNSDLFLNNKYVSWKGQEGITVFKNSTRDTLKLNLLFFNWLPYYETTTSLKIAPGKQDSVSLQFNYPDFIIVNGAFRVVNGPGGTVVCDIISSKPKAISAAFSGDYGQQNDYYLAYNNFLGSPDNESRAYYSEGDKIADWNKYPALSDSINRVRLHFLENYKGALPEWFVKHERLRLAYNNYFRIYNAHISKEFYGGKPLPVDPAFYRFEQNLKLPEHEMIVNSEYLWAMDFYLSRLAKQQKVANNGGMIAAIDSLAPASDVGDILKMRLLGALYMANKARYDSVISNIKFKDTLRRVWVDSLIKIKMGLPKIGAMAPGFTLTNIAGEQISLKNFKGKVVIINFWATWCGPCLKEFPFENALYNKYQSKGLVVLNVCVESSLAKWKDLSVKSKLMMPNLFCNDREGKQIKAMYNISSLPRSIMVDKNGRVVNNYLARASNITDDEVIAILDK